MINRSMPHLQPSNGRSLGQGLVEFALVFPLLIAVFFAILEFGFYMMTNLTLQNATREGARMAATLIDLANDDPRVLTFVEDLIPNEGPFAGFVGGVTNTGITDCESDNLITVNVEGQYDFVALGFLGLNGINVEYPATTHYELCGIFPVSDTAVPTAPTLTPSNTGTSIPSPTPSSTFTPSNTPTSTPTASRTPTPSNTPIPSNTPSPTPTSATQPAAPVYVSIDWTRFFFSCRNISITWDANDTWATVPGFGPTSYQLYRNGNPAGTLPANYPNNVAWNTGDNLGNFQNRAYAVEALFPGGLVSSQLAVTLTCWFGSIIID